MMPIVLISCSSLRKGSHSMTKVFESSKEWVATPDNKFNLYIAGNGMFMLRSTEPVDDLRPGVKTDVYYTRCGEFYWQKDGTLADKHGGVLQVIGLDGSTCDASIKSLIKNRTKLISNSNNEIYKVVTKTAITGNDVQISSNRYAAYESLSDDLLKSWDTLKKFAVWHDIKLIPELKTPAPAKLASGKDLPNCWTGEEVIIDHWRKPCLYTGCLEKLNPQDTYQLTDTIIPAPTTNQSWSLSLWRRCLCLEEEVPTPLTANVASAQMLSKFMTRLS